MSGESRFAVECYGVKVGVAFEPAEAGEGARSVILGDLPRGRVTDVSPESVDVLFTAVRLADGSFDICRNGEFDINCPSATGLHLYLEKKVRLAIAEEARDFIFVHAGAVGWKGRGIVFPARTFQGKSTLTRELIRLGAEYYSDDFAVIDEEGRLHPFARPLSIRDDPENPFLQRSVLVEEIGGRAGATALPVAMVAFTTFVPDAIWKPETLTPGAGVFAMLSHTIPIICRPEFSLKVLNNAVKHAIIVKSDRGDAADTAARILTLIDDFSPAGSGRC